MDQLDGPMATALLAAGETLDPVAGSAPLCRTRPAAVLAVHGTYLDAGASLLRTNTFMAAMAARPTDLVRTAAELAREVAGGRARIMGSLGPFGARGDALPDAVARHRELLTTLRAAGCRHLLMETLRTTAEVKAAVGLAGELGGPVWIAVVPGSARASLGGDRLIDLARASLEVPDSVFGLNCAPVDLVARALHGLVAAGLPPARLAAWPGPAPDGGLGPALVEIRRRWPELHALGACCGGTASDVAALAPEPCAP